MGGSGMDAMVSGSRVDCILGLVRIGDFSVATEVLQGKVMTFVNQVAEIVHGIVDEFAGAANKNNGETFMLVWRTEERDQTEVAKMADMSLVAFAKVLGATHRSRTLAAYRAHPLLKQRLGIGWHVSLTMGLHFGWAIEGAVGSEFKIDASYLSPNVSIAGSVEHAATMIYGVNICATESLVTMCSKEMAKKLRMIDRVVIKGSKIPLDLYSLDLDCLRLQVDPAKPRSFIWNLRQRYNARQMLEIEKKNKWLPDVSIVGLFDDCPDVKTMRLPYKDEFLEVFKMGYQNYCEGEWEVARRLLSITQDYFISHDSHGNSLGFKDGPSEALLGFMRRYDFEAPKEWHGIHKFAEHYEDIDVGIDGAESSPGSTAQPDDTLTRVEPMDMPRQSSLPCEAMPSIDT
jgi:class 3 adenylate cyclase